MASDETAKNINLVLPKICGQYFLNGLREESLVIYILCVEPLEPCKARTNHGATHFLSAFQELPCVLLPAGGGERGGAHSLPPPEA